MSAHGGKWEYVAVLVVAVLQVCVPFSLGTLSVAMPRHAQSYQHHSPLWRAPQQRELSPPRPRFHPSPTSRHKRNRGTRQRSPSFSSLSSLLALTASASRGCSVLAGLFIHSFILSRSTGVARYFGDLQLEPRHLGAKVVSKFRGFFRGRAAHAVLRIALLRAQILGF